MIREVTIRRFKRFENQTFPLEGNLVIAGQNNAGKTTLLQAIATWEFALKRWREQETKGDKQGGNYSRVPVSREAFHAVKLRSFDLLWHNRARAAGSIEIEIKTVRGESLAMVLESDSTEQIYVRPAKRANSALAAGMQINVVFLPSIGAISVKEPEVNPDWVKTQLGQMLTGEVIRNVILLVSKTDEWEHFNGALRRMFGLEMQRPVVQGGQIFCEYCRAGQDAPKFDILSAGSGFQQVVLVLATMLSQPGSVLLVDEPDAHLHVYLQATIFSELQAVAARTHSQLIVATHSEVIFNSVEPDQICLMMGTPRRLADRTERERLRKAMGVLQQADVVAAAEAPGVLYVEGHTDFALLKAWCRVLNHRAGSFFERHAFWREVVANPQAGQGGIKADDHFRCLQLADRNFTGVHLIDSDGKRLGIAASPQMARSALNRLVWSRYEAESYLLHPAALARFIESQAPGADAANAIREFFVGAFGAELAEHFLANPFAPKPIVESFLQQTKAREKIIPPILLAAGILGGVDYSRFSEIAALMKPEEVHPEVAAKLDAIAQAFGL
jgi:predicted ATPase